MFVRFGPGLLKDAASLVALFLFTTLVLTLFNAV